MDRRPFVATPPTIRGERMRILIVALLALMCLPLPSATFAQTVAAKAIPHNEDVIEWYALVTGCDENRICNSFGYAGKSRIGDIDRIATERCMKVPGRATCHIVARQEACFFAGFIGQPVGIPDAIGDTFADMMEECAGQCVFHINVGCKKIEETN